MFSFTVLLHRQLSILVKERHEAFARLKTLEDLMDALRKENELLRQGLAAAPASSDNKVATGSEGTALCVWGGLWGEGVCSHTHAHVHQCMSECVHARAHCASVCVCAFGIDWHNRLCGLATINVHMNLYDCMFIAKNKLPH